MSHKIRVSRNCNRQHRLQSDKRFSTVGMSFIYPHGYKTFGAIEEACMASQKAHVGNLYSAPHSCVKKRAAAVYICSWTTGIYRQKLQIHRAAHNVANKNTAEVQKLALKLTSVVFTAGHFQHESKLLDSKHV